MRNGRRMLVVLLLIAQISALLVSCAGPEKVVIVEEDEEGKQVVVEPPAPRKAYLLVTLDEVYIHDTTDAGGEGEISIWTYAEGFYGPGHDYEDLPPDQGNAYPHPNYLAVLAKDNQTLYPGIPVYYEEWDKTPLWLAVTLYVSDDDQGPLWISESIKATAEVLKTIGEVGNVIVSTLPSLAIEGYKEGVQALLGEGWFSALLIDGLMQYLVWNQDLYTNLSAASRALRLTQMIGRLTEHWGHYIDSPDTVLSANIWSYQLTHPERKSPRRENDWGLLPGDQSVTYEVCYRNPENGECDASKHPIAKLSFHRVYELPNPVRIDVNLMSVILDDNREWGTPEVFIHTRFVDDKVAISEIPGVPKRIARGGVYKSNEYFLGTVNRYPHADTGVNFYTIEDGKKYRLFQSITPLNGHVTTSPFMYYEISVFEYDGAAVLEDTVDELGTFTLFTYTEGLPEGEECTSWRLSEYGTVEVCLRVRPVTAPENTPTPAPSFPSAPTPPPCTHYLGFNNARAPFDNADTRRLFASFIDREALLGEIGPEGREPATSFVPPSIWPDGRDNYNSVGIAFRSEDIDSFNDIIGRDGDLSYPERIVVGVPTSGTGREIAEFLARNWRDALGIDVEIVAREWPSFLEELDRGSFDAYIMGWCADYATPYNFLHVFCQECDDNHSAYSNPHYDALLAESLSLPAEEDRLEIYQEAEIILCEVDAAIAPLYHYIRADD